MNHPENELEARHTTAEEHQELTGESVKLEALHGTNIPNAADIPNAAEAPSTTKEDAGSQCLNVESGQSVHDAQEEHFTQLADQGIALKDDKKIDGNRNGADLAENPAQELNIENGDSTDSRDLHLENTEEAGAIKDESQVGEMQPTEGEIKTDPESQLAGSESAEAVPEAAAEEDNHSDSSETKVPSTELELLNQQPESSHHKEPAEEAKVYSDDEMSLVSSSGSESDSSDDDSSDDDSEYSTSDSDLKSNRDNEGIEEEDSVSGPIRSKNEADEAAYTLPEDYQVPEDAALEFVGEITGFVEKSAIIKANTSGEFRILKDKSVLCFEDRSLLGPLFETFGRLQSPNYRVKFSTEEDMNAVRAKNDVRVFYVVGGAEFLYTDAIKKLKGTDASNCHDEELPEEEQEFSDDEQELALRQEKKRRKKQDREPEVEEPKKRADRFTSYGFADLPAQRYAQYDTRRAIPGRHASASAGKLSPQRASSKASPNSNLHSNSAAGSTTPNVPEKAPILAPIPAVPSSLPSIPPVAGQPNGLVTALPVPPQHQSALPANLPSAPLAYPAYQSPYPGGYPVYSQQPYMAVHGTQSQWSPQEQPSAILQLQQMVVTQLQGQAPSQQPYQQAPVAPQPGQHYMSQGMVPSQDQYSQNQYAQYPVQYTQGHYTQGQYVQYQGQYPQAQYQQGQYPGQMHYPYPPQHALYYGHGQQVGQPQPHDQNRQNFEQHGHQYDQSGQFPGAQLSNQPN